MLKLIGMSFKFLQQYYTPTSYGHKLTLDESNNNASMTKTKLSKAWETLQRCTVKSSKDYVISENVYQVNKHSNEFML